MQKSQKYATQISYLSHAPKTQSHGYLLNWLNHEEAARSGAIKH